MKKKFILVINILIILLSIIFTYGILMSSAANSCLELREQYFDFKTKSIAQRLETGIKAGLDINKYYGIDSLAERMAMYSNGHICAVVLNENNDPIASSLNIKREYIASVISLRSDSEAAFADLMNKRILSQPFKTENGYGHIALVYDKTYFSRIKFPHLIAYYKETLTNISNLALRDIVSDVKALHDKGLKADDIASMEPYFNSMLSDFGLIEGVAVGYDTDGVSAFTTDEGSFNVNIVINTEYIKKTYLWIFFTLVATLIICIMIVVEFVPVVKIINSKVYNNDVTNNIPIFIRSISFFVYLAVYTSLPYGAIIINSRGESILGLPVSVCASLPITLEAIALLVMLSVSPIIFNKTGIKKYTLTIGLCTVIPSFICFAFTNIYTIIICSVFLGITQGALKYLMNYLISICSENAEDISINYGQFNIGTLTGITVGGSLGSIIAADSGYTSVYIASAVIMLAIIATALICMPYEYINSLHNEHSLKKQYSYSAFLRLLMKSPGILVNMIFSVGVVAIALMYIVAFMPVALDINGLSPTVGTYGFLIYGIAGNYISGYLLLKAKALKRKTAAFIAMLTIAMAVLIIIPHINTITILAASLLAGIFDGYGAPSVTSALLNFKKIKKTDSSLILTGTSIIGGIGNVAAPIIYSMILYSDNVSVNLCLLFAFFLFSGVYILNMRD